MTGASRLGTFISKSKWGPAALIVVVILIACLPALRGGFILDDDEHLTKNPCIVGPLGLAETWTTKSAVYYPLVLASFSLQHAVWDLNPFFYHLFNVLMHAACAVLFWQVLKQLAIPDPPPVVAPLPMLAPVPLPAG